MKRTLLVLLLLLAAGLARAAEVSVRDSGPSTHPGTWECVRGHTIQARQLVLDNGKIRYAFAYTGCIDPSHGEERPASEGNFGMPEPTRCNFYAGGFIGIAINGKDAVRYRVIEAATLETGARGSFQVLFNHPDAVVGMRLMLLPGGNHVLCCVQWKPKPEATVNSVAVTLRCYPSYFTTFNHRDGDRHCMTPRTDEKETRTLALVPAEDAWLYYYDTIFDVARGEGDGPCAALVAPEGLTSGAVSLGSYMVGTTLNYRPEAGTARLGFYDLAGLKNAEAEAYLKQHGAADLAELRATDFRPAVVQHFDAAKFRDETAKLLAGAAGDGQRLKPKVDELLGKVTAEQGAADTADWQAEARLSGLLRTSEELLWELRIFAMLNG
ncbi:MAG: hypothetical protein HYU66_07850 [Armatimonadetes bacterium]|nr:hypothetical protein [Armatimonadota bacterium]